MMKDDISADERRMVILRGIRNDDTPIEIATEMGVRKWIVLNDLRVMRYNKDPELKQAYTEKEKRTNANKQRQVNIKDERFQHMTGMTFQEKNFQNMINYYKAEILTIYESIDQCTAITGLSKDIRKVLKHNNILSGQRGRIQLTAKARDYLLLRN